MIVVTGRVQAAPSCSEELVRVAQRMCEASRLEPGCLSYRFYADTEEPDRFLFVEEWVDDDALQSHFAEPHTMEFLGALDGLLTGTPDARFHTVASTRRLTKRGLVDI